MIFREARIEDIKQIQIIRNAVKENILSDPSLVTDQECQEIIGFAIADLKENNIWALFLDPKFEKKGIGKELHKIMLDWYFTKTENTVWLGTEFNTRAEQFYRTAGWKEVGLNGTQEIKFEMTKADWQKLN
jgi:GNAT superfamily N-acetyltransferase